MPTGYTAAVQDGTITDFGAFARQCARAFGATLHQRDDPLSAELKLEKPSGYHATEIDCLLRRLVQLKRMSPIDAQHECQADYNQQVQDWKERCDDRAMHRVRYGAMLDKAEHWKAPTPDHLGLKSFMIKQLNESLQWDCGSAYGPTYPAIKRWPEWLAEQIANTEADIVRHMRYLSEDVDRVANRNNWILQLLAALPHKCDWVRCAPDEPGYEKCTICIFMMPF